MAEGLKTGDLVERHMRDGDIVLFNRQPCATAERGKDDESGRLSFCCKWISYWSIDASSRIDPSSQFKNLKEL